ncbi:MAG: nucleoside monophosphate kinase [Spirochaetales bacterium]|nr:nucleoside monophosphate kinase [Spirochaetales bacterium]
MAIILLGPPGAGKGTLAEEIKTAFHIPHISTGSIFREAAAGKTPLGEQVRSILASGGLVPDELTIALVRDRLKQGDTERGYILDGFPRTLPQAEALEGFARPGAVINLCLPEEEVTARLSGRRTCPACGEIFHVRHRPSRKEGLCDRCGAGLTIRPDDEEGAIKNRLRVYRTQTAVLEGFYRERGLCHDLDCHRPPAEIWKELKPFLQGLEADPPPSSSI